MSAAAAFGRRYPRLAASLIAVAVAGVLIGGVWLPYRPARVAVVLPLLLYVPGSVLARVAFGPRGTLPLARVVLSFVLSIGILALLCVGLSAVSLSLTRASIALATGVWIAAIGSLAAWRDAAGSRTDEADETYVTDEPEDDEFVDDEIDEDEIDEDAVVDDELPRAGGTGRTILVALGIGATIAAATGLAVAARHLPPAPPAQPFSSLYLTGASSDVQQPITYVARTPVAITVGLDNHSTEAHTYELIASINKKIVPYQKVQVAAGGAWQGTVSGVPPTDGCLDRLTITAVPLGGNGKPAAGDRLSIGVWLQPFVEGPHCPKAPG